MRRRYGVKFYGRFKDDILIIFDGSVPAHTWGNFVRAIRLKSKFFKIKTESMTKLSVNMLDVTLSKDSEWERTGRLSHYCFIKPTSIYTPLALSSAHPLHVHLA